VQIVAESLLVFAVLCLAYVASGRRLAPVILVHGVLDTVILTALYVNGGVVS